MAFSADGEKVWPVTPDWSNGVRESLAWATEVSQASATAATYHRSYRIGPTRSFQFDVTAWGVEHRALDMLLAGHRGAWLLPIWPDVHWLGAELPAESEQVPCPTAGRDFVAGGKALLYRAVNTWDVVDVVAIEDAYVELAGPTPRAYGPGDRLYPLRRAWAADGAQARMATDAASRRSLSFDIAEACDWPALADGVLYRGAPVLESRPDASDDPLNGYEGLREVVDYDVGIPVVSDLPQLALRTQRDTWELHGRAEHTWFRSLLYAHRGRLRRRWVPSWQADLAAVAAIGGGSTALTVRWAGYTLFALGKENRQDLRIELTDGTVFYRRVTGALEVGNTETLTLDASLDVSSIAAGRIRQISIMALCVLASDSTEIAHETDADGRATAATGWQAVVADV